MKANCREEKKPGVMIYFSPMREEAMTLDDSRCAGLFRAILNFADPDSGEEPSFDDEVLRHLWPFIRNLIVVDDRNYHEKTAGKKYAAFCRFSRANGFNPPSREEWDELDRPSFREWTRMQNTRTHADAMQNMPYSYAESDSDSNTDSKSKSNSKSNSNSDSNAEAESVSVSISRVDAFDAEERPAPPTIHSPTVRAAFKKWLNHWEQITGQKMPVSSRNALAERFQEHADLYSPPDVADLIDDAIASAYKSIPWDRLERKWNAEAYGAQYPPYPSYQAQSGGDFHLNSSDHSHDFDSVMPPECDAASAMTIRAILPDWIEYRRARGESLSNAEQSEIAKRLCESIRQNGPLWTARMVHETIDAGCPSIPMSFT